MIYDDLFPRSGDWFFEPHNTQIKSLKLMPQPYHGLGAANRKWFYEVDEYDELNYSDWTASDLADWHNSLIELLS